MASGYYVQDGMANCSRCQTLLDLKRINGQEVLECWLCGDRHHLDKATAAQLEPILATHRRISTTWPDKRKADSGRSTQAWHQLDGRNLESDPGL